MDYVDAIANARYELIGEIPGKSTERVSKPKTISDLIEECKRHKASRLLTVLWVGRCRDSSQY